MRTALSTLVLTLILAGFSIAEKVTPIIPDGGQAPTFMLPSLDDQRVSLRDYCGQIRSQWKNTKRYITILSFMASYCVPCRHEIPQVEAFAKTLEDDVKILFISVDTISREQLQPFAQQMNIKQTILLDRYGQVMKKFGVQKLPSLFIIDKDGAIRYQNLNGLPADLDLAALLKEQVLRARTPLAAATSPAVPASIIPGDRKLAALRGLLAAKPVEDILRETGLSADELNALKTDVENLAREKWGAQ